MKNQLDINKVQEEQNKSFQRDLSLLKILCLQQNQKITQLEQRIIDIGTNSQSLLSAHEQEFNFL